MTFFLRHTKLSVVYGIFMTEEEYLRQKTQIHQIFRTSGLCKMTWICNEAPAWWCFFKLLNHNSFCTSSRLTWTWLSLRTSPTPGSTPRPRRPDHQPPQTRAFHVASIGTGPEDGRHVTATTPPPPPLDATTGGPGALPKPPGYRRRTVKGHCVWRYRRR